VKNLLKNSHSRCKKKGAALHKMARVEKLHVKSRWQPRNGCDGLSMAKKNNSGEFCADS